MRIIWPSDCPEEVVDVLVRVPYEAALNMVTECSSSLASSVTKIDIQPVKLLVLPQGGPKKGTKKLIDMNGRKPKK